MKPQRLQRSQLLPISRNQAWEFFSDPRNLGLITPPDLAFRITSELPPQLYAGMIINYTVVPFGSIRVDWTTEITHLREPEFFVDEQRIGPYGFWHHQHSFSEHDCGTEMTDIVTYSLPFGFLGCLFLGMVRGRLDAIFDFRHLKLEDLFGKARN